jgi:SAM-dependent methyltransferase
MGLGAMVRFYDVFVDWRGRLAREMPGLVSRLRAVEARRVLDVGCGTGRHVAALLVEDFDAYGADVSDEMLRQAEAFTGEPDRFFNWRLGDAPPDVPAFDALVSMGNVWPSVVEDADVSRSCAAFRRLLRPGGLLVMGLKALALRRQSGNPYMPLLRREQDGHAVHFVRFVDFAPDPPLCNFHMLVVPDGDDVLHVSHRMRAWSARELAQTFTRAGFVDVRVSGSLEDPDAAPTTEDIYLHATNAS